MISDIDTVLNDLLVSWHKWCAAEGFGKGYPSVSTACKQSRTSRQYDDQNGALDAAVDESIMEAFDAAMDQVAQPWRTALSIQARNMASGVNAWSSPRLPVDPMERGILTMEARNMLLKVLAKGGVLS